MKKLLIINHYPFIGGAGVSLYYIAKAFGAMSDKYKLVVYCPAYPPYMADWLESNNVLVYRAKTAPAILSHYSGCSRSILSYFSINNLIKLAAKQGWAEIKEAIKKIDPDFIAINTMTLAWLGPLLKNFNKKLVCFHRETYAKGLFGLRTAYIKRRLANDFDLVVFISKFDLIGSGDLNGKAAVITDKVSLEEFQRYDKDEIREKLGLSPRAYTIGYLGGISKLKGPHLAISALGKLKDSNTRLLFLNFNVEKRRKSIRDCRTKRQKVKFILGIDYEANLLKLIEKHKLWDRIDFFPAVRDPAKYICSSDVIIFPSTAPHQARPVYEAGAAGRPIVITNFNNTAEHAQNGYNCLTFENGNVNDLVAKIETLRKDKQLCDFLVNNNYTNAITKHNFQFLAKELDDLFSQL